MLFRGGRGLCRRRYGHRWRLDLSWRRLVLLGSLRRYRRGLLRILLRLLVVLSRILLVLGLEDLLQPDEGDEQEDAGYDAAEDQAYDAPDYEAVAGLLELTLVQRSEHARDHHVVKERDDHHGDQ